MLRDDAVRLYEMLKGDGVNVELEVYKDMVHVFQLFRVCRSAGVANDRSSEWISKTIKGMCGMGDDVVYISGEEV